MVHFFVDLLTTRKTLQLEILISWRMGRLCLMLRTVMKRRLRLKRVKRLTTMNVMRTRAEAQVHTIILLCPLVSSVFTIAVGPQENDKHFCVICLYQVIR